MREKAACATLNMTPGAYGGAAPASDHLPIARRTARADDHVAKTLLFEVPLSLIFKHSFHPLCLQTLRLD
jgi:hypothetical protein